MFKWFCIGIGSASYQSNPLYAPQSPFQNSLIETNTFSLACLLHFLGTSPADRNSSASSDADDESHIVDNILGDIRCGFIQKKSFGDTAFTVTKVKKVSI